MRELTLKMIIKALFSRIVFLIAIPLVAIVVTAFVNWFMIDPVYTAKTTMYVLNRQNENQVNISDLNTGAMLIADYKELATSNRVMGAVMNETGLDVRRSFDVNVASASNTRLVEISVTGKNAEESAKVANSIAANLSDAILDVMRVENISVVDPATAPLSPSAPNKTRNVAIAGFLAFALTVMVILLIEMLDTTIKTDEDVQEILKLPVLAKIPKQESRRNA